MLMVDTKDIEWEDPPRGYYLTDVKQKVLWRDEETGAMMALLKFPVGIADEIHSHPEANQLIYCIEGEIETPDGVKIPMGGVFTHTPKGRETRSLQLHQGSHHPVSLGRPPEDREIKRRRFTKCLDWMTRCSLSEPN